LSDARVLLTSEYLSEPEELQLRDIVVDDIGAATGGATYSEAAQAMLQPVLAAARTAAGERLKAVAAGAASDAVRDELDEETDEIEKDVSERIDELLDRG
jgi:hypothetical protein